MKTILKIFALVLAGCGGTGENFGHQVGAAGEDPAGPVTEAGSVNAGAVSGGSGTAGGLGGASGGASPSLGGTASAAGEPSSAGAPEAGQGGAGGESDPPGPAGAAGMPTAGTGGTGPTCEPVPYLEACEGRSCGKVPNGCGSEFSCGSCSGVNECVEGSCQPTCGSLALECGSHPEVSLECGECSEGQDCGVIGNGKCSTCKEIGPSAAVCPSNWKLWRSCSASPGANCWHPPDADPNWWCCQ